MDCRIDRIPTHGRRQHLNKRTMRERNAIIVQYLCEPSRSLQKCVESCKAGN